MAGIKQFSVRLIEATNPLFVEAEKAVLDEAGLIFMRDGEMVAQFVPGTYRFFTMIGDGPRVAGFAMTPPQSSVVDMPEPSAP